MENKMLVDTNVNLVNKIKLIEKECNISSVGLVSFYIFDLKVNYLLFFYILNLYILFIKKLLNFLFLLQIVIF